MDIPPDKLYRGDLIRENFNREPSDWFQSIPEIPENIKYNIERIIVLTTKEVNRYEKFLSDNKSYNIEFVPYYGDYNELNPPLCIFNNYINILNEEFVDSDIAIIIEDDVKLLPGWKELLEKSMLQLPKNWDTLSGNFSYISKMVKISENLIKPVGIKSSMNFTIFHKRSLDRIINNQNLGINNINQHFDRYCFSAELGLSSYGTWPMICRENSGYSINNKKEANVFSNLMKTKAYKYWFIDKPKWGGSN